MDNLGALVPIIGIVAGMIFLVSLIFTLHQQKMAQLIHGKHADDQAMAPVIDELRALRHEVAMLKNRVDTQQIDVDDVKALVANAPVIPPSMKQDA